MNWWARAHLWIEFKIQGPICKSVWTVGWFRKLQGLVCKSVGFSRIFGIIFILENACAGFMHLWTPGIVASPRSMVDRVTYPFATSNLGHSFWIRRLGAHVAKTAIAWLAHDGESGGMTTGALPPIAPECGSLLAMVEEGEDGGTKLGGQSLAHGRLWGGGAAEVIGGGGFEFDGGGAGSVMEGEWSGVWRRWRSGRPRSLFVGSEAWRGGGPAWETTGDSGLFYFTGFREGNG
jgi:hypothetical protein